MNTQEEIKHLRRYYLFSSKNNYPIMYENNLIGLEGIEQDLSFVFNAVDPQEELKNVLSRYPLISNEEIKNFEILMFDIEIDDVVCLINGKKINAIGFVESNYQYNQNKQLPHARKVKWIYEGSIDFEDGNHRLSVRAVEKEETYQKIEAIINETLLREDDNEIYINYPSRITVNSYLKFFKKVKLNPHEMELLRIFYLNPKGISIYEIEKQFDGTNIEDSIEFLAKKISLRFHLKSVELKYSPNIFNGRLRDGRLCLILKKELIEAIEQLNLFDINQVSNKTNYDIKQALANNVYSKETYETALNLLKSKKVIQIIGPWLSGKSYFARRLAYLINNNCNLDQILHLKMHSSISYDDLLVNDQTRILYRFIEKARRNSLNNYVIVIEDAHEVDLGDTFGEFMYLLEDNNRDKESALDVVFDTQKYYIPQNVYVIITSRNISSFDDTLYATNILIFEMPTLYNSRFIAMFENKELGQDIASTYPKVNEILKSYNFSINHGLFLKKNRGINLDEYEIIINYKIKPLIKTIVIDDDYEKISTLINKVYLNNK